MTSETNNVKVVQTQSVGQSTLEPQIYVACLAIYNSGILHGEWIDATLSVDEIQDEIKSILTSSPIANAKEWAIHDYSDFWAAELGEYPSLDSVSATAQILTEHGHLGAKVIAYCSDLEEATEMLEERYCGEYTSVEDYAQSIIEETTEIPESLINYIDYQAIARDMEINGDIVSFELSYQEVHIFSH